MKKLILLLSVFAAITTMSCKKSNGDTLPEPPRTEVPDEIVGAWEHGFIDFDVWENYTEGHWAGRNAIPSREAMIFTKEGLGSNKIKRY